MRSKRDIWEKLGNISVFFGWMNVTPLNANNRPFAGSSHMYKSYMYCRCWEASCTVGIKKQKQVKVDWSKLLWFGSPFVRLVSRHVWFCNMWADFSKGLLACLCFVFYFMVFSFSSQCIFLYRVQPLSGCWRMLLEEMFSSRDCNITFRHINLVMQRQMIFGSALQNKYSMDRYI